MGSNMFLTYIVRRKPVEMGLDQGEVLQINRNSLSNKTVFYGLAQKSQQFAREHGAICKIQI